MKANICFFIRFRSLLLRIRNVSGKIYRENENTHIWSVFSFSENRILYKKTCGKIL